MGEPSESKGGGNGLTEGYVRTLFRQICDYIHETNPIVASILAQGNFKNAEEKEALEALSRAYRSGETLLTALEPLADGRYANERENGGGVADFGSLERGVGETRGVLPELPGADGGKGGET